MVIKEAVLINADLATIWKTFTDLTCWADWNDLATNSALGSGRLEEGDTFTFCLRPFPVPITIEPKIEEVILREKVVWSGGRFGYCKILEKIYYRSVSKCTSGSCPF